MTKKSKHDDDDLQQKLDEARKQEEEKRAKEETTLASENSDEIATLEEELAKMTELAKRTMADMQNLKRRTEEERASLYNMATADFIKQILPVLDNMDRAKAQAPADAGEWFKGMEMCIADLHKVFTDAGLQKMKTVGQQFDPNLHEAVMQDTGPQNEIMEELESGYMIGNQVIRHAKVKVGDGSK